MYSEHALRNVYLHGEPAGVADADAFLRSSIHYHFLSQLSNPICVHARGHMQYHQYSGKLIRYYHAASWSERPHHAVSNSFEDRQ